MNVFVSLLQLQLDQSYECQLIKIFWRKEKQFDLLPQNLFMFYNITKRFFDNIIQI